MKLYFLSLWCFSNSILRAWECKISTLLLTLKKSITLVWKKNMKKIINKRFESGASLGLLYFLLFTVTPLIENSFLCSMPCFYSLLLWHGFISTCDEDLLRNEMQPWEIQKGDQRKVKTNKNTNSKAKANKKTTNHILRNFREIW